MGGRQVSEFLPLPQLSFQVLLALGEGAAHGWVIIRRIRELGGGTSPSSGSLYLAMARMEDSGLIEEAPRPADDADARRRYYRLTRLGRAVASAEAHRLEALVAQARQWNLMGERG